MLDSKPKTRADCVRGIRPCPWVSCRYHLLLDRPDPEDVATMGRRKTRLKLLTEATDAAAEEIVERWAEECDDLEESCALDLADWRGMSQEEVGEALDLSEEGVRLIEERAMDRIARIARGDEIGEEEVDA